mgnify:CR=1 FL=1
MKNDKKELLISVKDLIWALVKLIGALTILVLAVKYLLS